MSARPSCVPANTVSPSMEEYEKAFKFFDHNNDGSITVTELENAMRKCGVRPTKLELRVFMMRADKDCNNVITFDEFVQAMQYQEKNALLSDEFRINEAEMRKQFKLFDKDGDGYIDLHEMNALVTELSLVGDYPIEVIRKVFLDADIDGDGRISFEGM